MKQVAFALIFIMSITFSLNAQHKKEHHKKPKFTKEQRTNIAIKKMTLSLGLSEKQQNQIKPLLMAQMASKEAAMAKRKKAKEENKKPTTDEIYAMQIKRLDNMILMKSKMKNILDKEQFEKFEKHQKRRHLMAKKKIGKKKMKMKHRNNSGKL
jgi:hypothetical protein